MRVKQAQSLGKVSNDAKQQMRMHVLSGLMEHMGMRGQLRNFGVLIDLLVDFLSSHDYKQSFFETLKFQNCSLNRTVAAPNQSMTEAVFLTLG